MLVVMMGSLRLNDANDVVQCSRLLSPQKVRDSRQVMRLTRFHMLASELAELINIYCRITARQDTN